MYSRKEQEAAERFPVNRGTHMEIEDTSVGVTAERKGRWGDTRHGHTPTFGTFFTFSASSASVRAATVGGDTGTHAHTGHPVTARYRVSQSRCCGRGGRGAGVEGC